MMRRKTLGPVCVALAACSGAACDVRDAFTADVELVARAGEHRLTVDGYARMLSASRRVPLRRDIVERFAHRWVEYSLYAQRVAQGDSLLDSAWVVKAMWPDLQSARVEAFHERLVERRLRVDSAAVDSAYQAGERRVIYHILVRTPPDAAPPEKERARRRAEAMRSRLLAGTPWDRLNEEFNDDAGARQAGGSLGVVKRGDLVPAFEEVAFRLAPGETSEVTETSFGYHVIWRPTLDRVRDQLQGDVRGRLVARMDSGYLVELETKWKVSLRAGAPALVREAAEAPHQVMHADNVLARYRGGKFTVADLIRWLQVMDAQVHQQLLVADDEQTSEFLRSLIRNELLIKEAEAAGALVPEEAFRLARGQHARELSDLRTKLALDSALAGATGAAERRRRAQEAVDRHVAGVLRTLRDMAIVPAFVANELRREGEWVISAAGVDRVVERATALRAQRGGSPATGDTAVAADHER